MSRELRTTLAIMAAVLLLSAPAIFADAPTQPTTSYLAIVFYQPLPTTTFPPTVTPRPTRAPSPTATPTNTPVIGVTLTPTPGPAPTTTPLPTSTPTDLFLPHADPPCDQNEPVQFEVGTQAWMTVTNPSRFSFVTLCARYIVSGGAVTPGSVLDATAHYKTTDTVLDTAIAGADGVAHITFNIGGATLGYTVVVDGTIGGHPFLTSFTPQ